MKFAFKNANFVIHCAAQKDVPKFESDVPTGYKTNILGTQYVSEAFMDSFNAISGIMLSTDKAVMPTTTYGISKLAAQQLWLWHTKYQKSVKMGAVTYGNVWGSRGSVIEAWTEKAKLGIPFLITDMSCTRYFMRIQDAAQFVLNSLFNNESKVHVPKMKSANMVDVAEVIWRHWQPNKALLMEVTGLRGTEKLHEALTTNGDSSETCEKFTAAELDQMYREWLKG
jgi:FlaA1/EpsC-like NDP-sugar epimerase